jgi:hypothetical protein
MRCMVCDRAKGGPLPQVQDGKWRCPCLYDDSLFDKPIPGIRADMWKIEKQYNELRNK